jgi:hypothetical protein
LLGVALRDIALAEIGFLKEFIGFGKDIEWFSGVVGQEGYD